MSIAIEKCLWMAIEDCRSRRSVGVRVDGLAEGFESAFEAEARPVDGQHLGVVEQAIEDGGGEGFVAERVGPFGDGLVGGDDRGAAGVAAGWGSDEQGGGRGVRRA